MGLFLNNIQFEGKSSRTMTIVEYVRTSNGKFAELHFRGPPNSEGKKRNRVINKNEWNKLIKSYEMLFPGVNHTEIQWDDMQSQIKAERKRLDLEYEKLMEARNLEIQAKMAIAEKRRIEKQKAWLEEQRLRIEREEADELENAPRVYAFLWEE